jgi:glycosyltransferase involved in cell wall biosynthesis
MKVAIIHYWLVTMRGGERVLEELCELYPDAHIYTHVVDRTKLSPKLRDRDIRTTFIAKLPFAVKCYQRYLPFMPMALEYLDLRGYDLVISSESGPAKGVITDPETLHICYCHSPMRYLWNMYHEYRGQTGGVTRFLMGPVFHYLRQWDCLSAFRVDYFVANSHTIAGRIAKYYRRHAVVIPPPVDTDAFAVADQHDDFYLFCGQLVGYKKADQAVKAFNRMGKRLIIIGTGEQYKMLKGIAGTTITMLGPQPFEVLKDHYARCRALIFPAEEDFGIVPVEAMACGRPVIAYGCGGALDTVVDGITGVLYKPQTVDALVAAVERFESCEDSFSSEKIRAHAEKFSRATFRHAFSQFVSQKIFERKNGLASGSLLTESKAT